MRGGWQLRMRNGQEGVYRVAHPLRPYASVPSAHLRGEPLQFPPSTAFWSRVFFIHHRRDFSLLIGWNARHSPSIEAVDQNWWFWKFSPCEGGSTKSLPGGLEPPTLWLTAIRSNQLSYGSCTHVCVNGYSREGKQFETLPHFLPDLLSTARSRTWIAQALETEVVETSEMAVATETREIAVTGIETETEWEGGKGKLKGTATETTRDVVAQVLHEDILHPLRGTLAFFLQQ